MTPMARTVAVIGAGPVGLAAAAHLLERDLEPVVLEAGPEAGHAVRQWAHVRLFSPWEFNVDQAAGRLLAAAGWNGPDPQHFPTGAELIENYLKPLAERTPLAGAIRTHSRVTGISRASFDKVKSRGREAAPFEVRYQNGEGPRSLLADAVIDAAGTWRTPNPAGANGLPAAGEREAAERIAYGMPDVLGAERGRYAGRRVAVLGAGHSAVGTVIDLERLGRDEPGTQVVWIIRGDDIAKAFGGGASDALAARGELGSIAAGIIRQGRVEVHSGFRVSHIGLDGEGLRIGSGADGRVVRADRLIVATGFRPDLSYLSELRVTLDPALDCPPLLAPLIDPNEHSCGTVRPHGARELAQPEPGLYLAGMKSYGRAPTFLMLTGYEQVRSIAAELAGDHEAARRVELVLPETGVCSLPRSADETAGCCSAPAVEAEAVGQVVARGCGCAGGRAA
jgi:thioredoxin reductase